MLSILKVRKQVNKTKSEVKQTNGGFSEDLPKTLKMKGYEVEIGITPNDCDYYASW